MNKQLIQASQLILQGKPVCFPTETVYALAADATNDLAVQRIYELKGRNAHTPLSLLLANLEVAKRYGHFSPVALALATAFWPGPLTLILPKKEDHPPLSSLINLGMNTIGIRIPNHDIAQMLITMIDRPIVATSANPSGHPSAVTTETIKHYFADTVYLVEDGQCDLCIASTIIDTTTNPATVIRLGSLSGKEVDEIISSH